ncbi:MAG: hypothetical protein CMC70_10995 [Flavobacteriaceae bacterium]|nr:hypothetical protein [Flavobacteriaceae bacterium]
MLKFILPATLFLTSIFYSQEKIEFVSTTNLTEEIDQQLTANNFKGVVEVLEKIKKNDSTYCSALSTKSYYQLQLENFDAVITTANEGIALGCHDVQEVFHINKLAAVLNKENYQEAIDLANNAIEKYPMNATLWYNKGYALEQLGQSKDAVMAYQESILRNPFNDAPHIKIGNLYYKQGKKAQALMAFNIFLLLQPDLTETFPILNQLNNISANPSDQQEEETELSVDDPAFKEINLILNQKVALSQGYDTGNRIDIALIKQNHALLTKLKDFKGKGGFWSEKYVPFYQWIIKEGLFNDFSYALAYSIENESLQKIVQRNSTEAKEFIPAAFSKWLELVSKNDTKTYEYSEGIVRAIGEAKADTPVGDWLFFEASGQQFLQGTFNKKGERDGVWRWNYTNGNAKEVVHYKDSVKNGEYTYYHLNGALNTKASYKNDALEGDYIVYNNKAALTHEIKYKAGKIDGNYRSYFAVGKPLLEFDVNYKNGEVTGDLLEYHLNGQEFLKTSYKSGKKHGAETRYYSNGKIAGESNYKDDHLHGPYVDYFKNGKIKEEGNYNEGKANGWWKSYYSDGVLESESLYNDGEIEGTSKFYNTEGSLHIEYEYKRGNIVAYKFFDTEGNLIKEDKKRGGKFNYISYSPYGIKLIEGIYDVDGGKIGEWVYYNDYGILQSKGVYEDNKLNGVYTTYHLSGEIETQSTYKEDDVDGYYTVYYPNGQLKIQGWYVAGVEQGEWRYYYPDGGLSYIAFYHNGGYHGDQISYSVDGTKDRISTYHYGNLLKEVLLDENGTEIQQVDLVNDNEIYEVAYTYANGNPRDVYTYKNGFKHGTYTGKNYYGNTTAKGTFIQGFQDGEWNYYYDNGTLESTRNYDIDKLEGVYVRYHENGKERIKTVYQEGEINGVYESFYENGQLKSKEFEVMGKNHGKKENFGEEGNLQLIRYYNSGRLTGYSYLDKAGAEVAVIPVKNGTAKVKAYYNNGKVSREFEYVNGELAGNYNTYHYNGKLQYETLYKDGKLDGADVSYYQDGTKKELRTYANDQLHGKLQKFYPSGTLKEEIIYVYDYRHGISNYYDEQGKLIKKETYRNGILMNSEKI